jgi:hypothetical protein
MSRWESEIDAELNWREAELASLKHFVISTRGNVVAHKSALRAMCAMMYAHYEGFTKFCWDLVLDEIHRAAVNRCDLLEPLAVLSLEKVFSQLKADTSPTNIWSFFQTTLPENLTIAAEFEEDGSKKCRISTGSNLWPNVFREGTQKLGIACTEVDNRETLLKSLVARRNKIAHGEKMEIKDLNEYKSYEDAAFAVMYQLAITIVEYLDRQLYLKANIAQAGGI